LARARAGRSIAARIAIIAITTNSSINVKARISSPGVFARLYLHRPVIEGIISPYDCGSPRQPQITHRNHQGRVSSVPPWKSPRRSGESDPGFHPPPCSLRGGGILISQATYFRCLQVRGGAPCCCLSSRGGRTRYCSCAGNSRGGRRCSLSPRERAGGEG